MANYLKNVDLFKTSMYNIKRIKRFAHVSHCDVLQASYVVQL